MRFDRWGQRSFWCACALAAAATGARAAAPAFTPGTRVLVDKAGAGHRAIVLRSEATRSFVAYEGADAQFDEWVEPTRLRPVTPPVRAEEAAAPLTATLAPAEPGTLPLEPMPSATPPAEPEPLPRTLELPRPARDAAVAPAWLEPLPRAIPDEPLRFNSAALAVPTFRFGHLAGLATPRPPLGAAFLRQGGRITGFASLEAGVALYAREGPDAFVRAGQLDLAEFGAHAPEHLLAADLNDDGATDLVVAGGPVAQSYFATADGRYQAATQAYRTREPLRGLADGRFFPGALSRGVAVIEGENHFRLLRATTSGLTPVGDPFQVRFDRILKLVAGDFDGDGFTDLALTAEHRGRTAGAWMYFNLRGTAQPFLWPVGGRDDFARDLAVADLDHDGRADLVLTDSDVARGEHLRVVFGAAGRAGWEDPWELLGSEFGVGLGTASVVTGDFNRDGRTDIGVAGRNGLRLHLGADYRRFSRNPVWPRLAALSDFPDQRNFLAGDLDGDGADDLLGYTPAFATGYNLMFNATPAEPAGVRVPPPLVRREAREAGTAAAQVEAPAAPATPGVPRLRHLASRTEPYGQYRYRVVLEVAALDAGLIEALDATARFEVDGLPPQQATARTERVGDEQWVAELILLRAPLYEFTLTARNDRGRASDPLRVIVYP